MNEEVDEQCLNCHAYHYLPVHISMDAWNDHPEENECDFNWECPYREEAEDEPVSTDEEADSES